MLKCWDCVKVSMPGWTVKIQAMTTKTIFIRKAAKSHNNKAIHNTQSSCDDRHTPQSILIAIKESLTKNCKRHRS